MRKIKLDLNDLQVASFVTMSPDAGGGTVLANAKTDVEATECCETYAAHICASADDGCATLAHAWTYCNPECETDPMVCPL
jgi:hypothetical protein